MKKILCFFTLVMFCSLAFPQQFTRDLKVQVINGERMHGSDVKQLQEKLVDMGYLPAGENDGWFGPKTEKALKSYQRDHGLQPTGILTLDDFNMIYGFANENKTIVEDKNEFIVKEQVGKKVYGKKLKLNSDANVRSLPSMDGAVLTILTEGTIVEGIKSSENSDWFEINLDGSTGYIHKSLVDSVFSTSEIKDGIIPFQSGLFWWIIIDKLILIGVFLYFIFTHKIGKGFLWALICLGCTILLAFIFTLIGDEIFIVTFGYTALLCIGVSPFILLLTILILILICAAGTKKEPKLKAVTYWFEE